MTDTQEAMRNAQSLHMLRMMSKDQQDAGIIMHYAAAAAVAMQGSRLVEYKRFGDGSEQLNEAIRHVADILRKMHQTDFGTTLPCNCTAKSAEKIEYYKSANEELLEEGRNQREKIARLEAEVEKERKFHIMEQEMRIAEEKKSAAAEFSNKQLLDVLNKCAVKVRYYYNRGAVENEALPIEIEGDVANAIAKNGWKVVPVEPTKQMLVNNKLNYKFTCPKCGFHGWGTSNCDKPFDQWFGHCNASGCGFSWHRETADQVYLKESA